MKDNVRSDPQKAVADFMATVAKADGCSRARRCSMVEYEETKSPKNLQGKGCCPGQTGHHLIPEEMVGNGCPGYDHEKAPTICVEGTTNTHGSHGAIHGNLQSRVADYRSSWFGGEELDYDDARNLAVKSFYDTFPESMCSRKCLIAQLDKYYKTKCTKNMKAAAGTAGGATTTGNKR